MFVAGARNAGQPSRVTSPSRLVEFQPSLIHGLGGFARSGIKAGVRILEYTGERITKSESIERCSRNNPYIFHLDDQWDLDGSVEWNSARLLNHSCAPNCDAECIDARIWILARRFIPAGEEITFNYSYDLENYREHPCRCRAPTCVGHIVAEEFMEHVRGRGS